MTGDIFDEILKRTKVSKEAAEEARARRDLIFQIAMTYDGALRTVKSGSIAHGTYTLRLEDADGSLVLNRRSYPSYGPDGDDVAPRELVEDVADFMRPIVQELFPKVWVSTNHKRAIFFRFFAPMDDDQEHDPTVDLVVSLTRKDGGLWIPNLNRGIWQPADPAEHTRLVAKAKHASNYKFSKTVRLAKLYAKQWSDPLLSSFHITALALEAQDTSLNVPDGLIKLFRHAERQLARYNTADPAGISEAVKIPGYRDRDKLVKKLKKAADAIENAINIEIDSGTHKDIMSALEPMYWNVEMRSHLKAATDEVERKSINASFTKNTQTPLLIPAVSARPLLNTRAYGSKVALTDFASTSTLPDNFDRSAFNSEYAILWKHQDEHSIEYTVAIDVPTFKPVSVKVTIVGNAASVQAMNVTGLRHIYDDGTLCLYHPKDPPERRWLSKYGLLPLLDLIKMHLYKEVEFKRNGGIWLGEEEHHEY